MGQNVKIRAIESLTHDVLQIRTEKPKNINYLPGMAADVSINKLGWENKLRAFTFTSLPENNFLEFVIKTYSDHNGVTKELNNLKIGDELIIGDVFGDIKYKGEGLFIAGGAGITPFIAIFKKLKNENKLGNNILLFANKTKADIIQEKQLSVWLGDNAIHVLSTEKTEGYEHGYISKEMISNALRDDLKYIYVCGPPAMMGAIDKHCAKLGLPSDRIVKEAF